MIRDYKNHPIVTGYTKGKGSARRILAVAALLVGGVTAVYLSSQAESKTEAPGKLVSELALPSTPVAVAPEALPAKEAVPAIPAAQPTAATAEQPVATERSEPAAPEFVWREHKIESGESLALIFDKMGLSPHLLDLRNSGDTAGDRQRVVGYAALAFTEDRPDARQ